MHERGRPLSSVPPWVHAQLESLSDEGLLRTPVPLDRQRPGEVILGSLPLLDFTSNDYLGLAGHPACLEGAAEALRAGGCGSRGSRLVTGDSHWQRSLEQAVAGWLDEPSAVLFPSGYQANVGVLTALLGPGDLVFSDAHNHASIVDGCRLSRAEILCYDHLDASALDRALAAAPPDRRRVVVTDSLFSMDGGLAPLADLAAACRRHDALLVVDEAHAMGVIGPLGAGHAAASGVRPTLRIGTFSKALGSHGAFVCGETAWIRYLHNRARALIYSTALPPASLGASLAAVALVKGPEGEERRARLQRLSATLRDGLTAGGVPSTGEGTPLISIGFDDPRAATAQQQALVEAGLLAWAFRPPTVPTGTSRLRLSLSADHGVTDVARLADVLVASITGRGRHPAPEAPG